MLRTFSTNRGTLKVMTIAVCPGSYDPVTAGHLDVIERCARFFDEVHVVVAVNAAKTPMFSEETRVEIIRQALAKRGCTNVKVASTTGLITDYCTKIGATVIVKGLRQNGDYEAELGMALVNRKLAGVETLFLPAAPDLEHISSSIVKDAARRRCDGHGARLRDSAAWRGAQERKESMMSEETNDFKPLADADDATSQQPVTAAADYPATGAVAGTAATNNSATGNAADRATDEPAKPAKSSKPSISMSDLPDLRATFDPNAPLDDSSDRSRDEFTTVYDIIDSIEEELDEAKPILFAPSSVRVDRESFTGKLDKLKKMLPVQLERASALMRESERRLESAQTQANAIIASAQSRAADTVREANEQAQFLAGQENVTELARQKARGILDQAQAKADKLTQNADKYCITMMESLQQQVDKIGTGVQAGLNVLYDRQREAGAYLDHLDADDYPEN